MEIVLIAIVAAAASLLTFFSGFGLGTILLPVFIIFFPVDLAIGLTAIVHFLNNIFKTGLIGRHAVLSIVIKFGLPALVFAFIGARLLSYLAGFTIAYDYQLLGQDLSTTPVNITIGILLLIFAVFELAPERSRNSISTSILVLGGMLSGFFGGLSGHQGALRSAFLIRLGLTKEQFIATGIIISLFVDISRLSVYWTHLSYDLVQENVSVLAFAILAAFIGAVIGRRLLRKVTMRILQYFVATLIAIVAILLILGIL